MKIVFEASTGVEAYMVSNLLQQEGIASRVDGEYLQGGIGDLQAINLVRVLVEDSDYEKARAIINEWESTQVEDTDAQRKDKRGSGLGTGLLFGFVIGAGLTFWAYNTPVTSDGIDYNDDGTLDEKWTYKDNRIYRTEVDRNLDGKIDAIHQFNYKGIIFRSKMDDDFDGVYETIYKYRRGNIYLQESDLDQDGHVDHVAHFRYGVLSEFEILDPYSRIPRKKQAYRMNKLVSSEFDSNGDGIYDTFYEYDYYEEVKKSSKLEGAGAIEK